MKKDVLITVSGLQSYGEGEETVEVTTVGRYYYKNNMHYLLYQEMIEGLEKPVTNTLKIQDGQVDVIKNGPTHAHMIFQKDQKSTSFYCTPYGAIEMGLDTKEIALQEKEEEMDIQIGYGVRMNDEYLGDCNIKIHVQSAG